MSKDWWKSTIIYQITLSSFFDGNNDGIGDFIGVKKKLNYLKLLGVETIWISPHYQSPMNDNGYDISDFYQTNPLFGNLNDFKEMISRAHELNIKVIADLVLNHTSDEHEWFKAATNPNHPYHQKYYNYYIWHAPKDDEFGNRIRPTRWINWFGGPAWDYCQEVGQYYLHIFSKKMPDLNWRNPELREEMKKIINYWIKLGLDGFRIDAANHLEKDWDFPDGYPGYEYFSARPKHHDYIKELSTECFEPNHLLIIGESGSATGSEALKYVSYDSHEFNLLIQFGHVWADICDDSKIFTGKWSQCPLKVSQIKKSFDFWFKTLQGKGWNLIYWHNHDHPRIVSHYGNDSPKYRVMSAKMLAISLYLMPGTSITYQGEEIGMTNLLYNDLKDFRDVEVFTEYDNFIRRGASHEMAMRALRNRSRDNSRSPMQWSKAKFAGFSKTSPFMKVNFNYQDINVEDDINNLDSIYYTYKFLLSLRKQNDANIAYGNIEFFDLDSEENFVYINHGVSYDYLVICNFTKNNINVNLNSIMLDGYKYFYSNSRDKPLIKDFKLEPYEAFVYQKNN